MGRKPTSPAPIPRAARPTASPSPSFSTSSVMASSQRMREFWGRRWSRQGSAGVGKIGGGGGRLDVMEAAQVEDQVGRGGPGDHVGEAGPPGDVAAVIA